MRCSLCDKDIPGKIGDLNRHKYAEHREISMANARKGAATRHAKAKGKVATTERPPVFEGAAPPPAQHRTEDPKLAQSIYIAPRAFYMSSQLLWQARDAAIKVWNWPANITMDDFLDTFLYLGFKERGVILGGFVVLDPKKEDKGNGNRPEGGEGRANA